MLKKYLILFQALKYEEFYSEALEMFDHACRLDPAWPPPRAERSDLVHFLEEATKLVRTRGKLKAKRLNNMIQVSFTLVLFILNYLIRYFYIDFRFRFILMH